MGGDRTLRGIDEQVAKAAEAVAGLAPVKRNRFVALDGAVQCVNHVQATVPATSVSTNPATMIATRA